MSTENQLFPPAVLFRSFLLVAGAYILSFVVLGVVGMLIVATLFPDSFEILNREPEQYQQIFEREPARIFPREMLWMLLGVSAAVCFVFGYLVARLAPIAKFSHSVFFAAILFVHYLQSAINAGETLQTMLILFMGVSPIAALLGANVFLQRDGGSASNNNERRE